MPIRLTIRRISAALSWAIFGAHSQAPRYVCAEALAERDCDRMTWAMCTTLKMTDAIAWNLSLSGATEGDGDRRAKRFNVYALRPMYSYVDGEVVAYKPTPPGLESSEEDFPWAPEVCA